MCPIDVVKTRIQLQPDVYNKGMIGGFRQVIAAEGVGSRLVRLTIAGAPLANPRTVYAICDEAGVETGAVTSAVYSPRLETNVAFAYVPVAAAEPGNRVSVMTPDGVREATVTDEHWQTP